jgi:uncharacterized protein
MELTNEFEVAVPVDRAWAVLTDLERIAPCMPGAQLQEVEGDEYRGVVKVKVGPITAQYKGKAVFQEKDDENHVAVLKADGRDTRGQGNASALITARLESAGEGTKVDVHTDLTVTGKVAQFGRGVMADVSAKLMDQFVENLETTVLAAEDADAAADEPGTAEIEAEVEAEVETEMAAAEVDHDTATPQATPAGGAGKASTEHVAEAAEEETSGARVTAPAESDSPGVRRIDHREAEPVDLIGTAGAPVAKRVVPAVAALIILLVIWRWLSGRDD